MNPFRRHPAQSATANPADIEDCAQRWRLSANETLRVMAKGGNPAAENSRLIKMPDGKVLSVFDVFVHATQLLCWSAGFRYDWFKPMLFLQTRDAVGAWCQGDTGLDCYLRAKRFVEIAQLELVRVWMTARKELQAGNPSANQVILRPDAERNEWCYRQYMDHPDKTLREIRYEAKTQEGWILGSDPGLKKAIERHCKDHGIEIPMRKKPRIKPD
jgi:hypothetical protein